MAEQLLDLAQVRAGMEERGGEHVPERVRGDPLALIDTGGVDVVTERLPELGVVEALALPSSILLWAAFRPPLGIALEYPAYGSGRLRKPLITLIRPSYGQSAALFFTERNRW